jgi:hypothetical protein
MRPRFFPERLPMQVKSLLRSPLLLLGAFFLCTLLPGLQSQARANIYICQDSDGTKHFTNMPESGNCVPFQKKQRSYSTAPQWSPPVHKAYDRYIAQYGKRYKVDPHLIRAVIKAESGFNRLAVSSRGAQGLMQLMPETARELNVSDPFNPDQNIDGGTRYLRYLLKTFNGDLTLALAAYNAGPSLVRKIQRVPRIPETVEYVKRVLRYYRGYGKGQIVDALYRSSIRVGGLLTIQ